jgi:hypothetical protein
LVGGTDWIRSFHGGLVTTCGLRHVGQPRDGHPLHGRYSQQRATILETSTWEADGGGVRARASIAEPGDLAELLEVDRTIETYAGRGLVVLTDVVTNRGAAPDRLSVLYHVNLATDSTDFPTVHVDDERLDDALVARARDTLPLPLAESGPSRVTVHDPRRSAQIGLHWDTEKMPLAYLWTSGTATGVVLAIEPSVAPLLGPHHADSGLVMEPGEEITLVLRFVVGPMTSQ